MGVGTSLGMYYDDEFHQAVEEWKGNNPSYFKQSVDSMLKNPGITEDDMVRTPLEVSPETNPKDEMTPDYMQYQKDIGSNYQNIYNDAGEIVDYDRRHLKPIPKIEPFLEFNEIDELAPKVQSIPQPKAGMKTSSPLVTITDEDIEKGIHLGMAFSGGGLGLKAPAKAGETVGKAALRNDAGEIFEGQTHGHAFDKYMAKYPDETNFGNVDQGFTTSKGRFVNREEAFQIAKERDQFIDKGIPPMDAFGLLSEDLK